MRVLVSGIGRSGTTMMYRQIGRMMRDAYEAPRFRYEPYLWNLNNKESAGFGPEDLSARGMQVHQATPLFLDAAHPVHDAFLWSLYGNSAPLPGDPQESPDSWLVKIIRGSGRLEAYLEAFPDLKIVICLRNPLDTLNSSLGMFSFTGEEFHASDRQRLLAEVGGRLPHLDLPPVETASHLAVSAVWWRAFTEWSMRLARKYPDRCFLYRHELMASDADAVIDRLTTFLGFSSSHVFKEGLSEPAGRTTTATYLLAADIGELYPHLQYYLDDCLSGHMPPQDLQLLEDKLLQRYAGGQFSPQLAGDRLGRRSTLALRKDILGGYDVALKYVPPLLEDATRIPLRARLDAHASSRGVSVGALKVFAKPPLIGARRETFGCTITCDNHRDTIRDAIYSALDQTKPFDRIIVVDDASTDGSTAILKDLEGRYSSLAILYRTQKGGASAARHQGLEMLGTDYLTQLDGADCFWPTKNREEGEVLKDDPRAVVFSRSLIDEGATSLIKSDHSAYVGNPREIFHALLARTSDVPHDMTIAAAAYSSAEGYDGRLRHFEEWDFQLRLAGVSGDWKMSGSHAGTLHNRRRASRAKLDAEPTRRELTQVFLKAVLQRPELASAGLANLYAQATRGDDDATTMAAYSFLLACDAGSASVSELKGLIEEQGVASADDDFNLSLRAVDWNRRSALDAATWRPVEGFGNNQAPFAEIPRDAFYWQLEPTARVEINVMRPVEALAVEFYNPVRENEVVVELTAKSGTVLRREFTIAKSEREGGVLKPITVLLETPLEQGCYALQLVTSRFTEKPGATGAPTRKLFVIVSGVHASSAGGESVGAQHT